MGVMGLLILLVLAISGPSLAVIKEYHHVAEPKSWTDAQTYCREMYDDLVTIESESEWAAVSDIITNSGHWAAWIGLYNDIHSWRWSLDNTDLSDDTWVNFINSNSGYCANLNAQDGSFSDTSCTSYHTYVCYDEPTNSYFPSTAYESWVNAQTHCRQTYTDLASVRNQQELDTIKNMIDSWAIMWIGLSSESWFWSDQSNSHFRLWMGGYPTGAGGMCTYAQVNGWMDGSCQDEHPFICSSVLPMTVWKAVKVGLKAEEIVDMNDNQIQGAALQQMGKQLTAQGVQQKLKLSWREHPNGEIFNQTVQ